MPLCYKTARNLRKNEPKKAMKSLFLAMPNHPEVKGVTSCTIRGALVVQSVANWHAKFKGHKIAVVSQTTRKINEFLNHTLFEQDTKRSTRRLYHLMQPLKNQDAAKELAQEADMVIIAGPAGPLQARRTGSAKPVNGQFAIVLDKNGIA